MDLCAVMAGKQQLLPLCCCRIVNSTGSLGTALEILLQTQDRMLKDA